MYIVSQDIIASTKPNTPSDLSHFILIYIALMNASDHVFEWSIVSVPTFLHCK